VCARAEAAAEDSSIIFSFVIGLSNTRVFIRTSKILNGTAGLSNKKGQL
jgi:hypothetical protein